MAAYRRFEWATFDVDQGTRTIIVLRDDKPPRGKSGDITNWLDYTPERAAALRALATWLNKYCPADLTADEFWASLHSEEG